MDLNIKPSGRALVTTNEWFYAPDGKQYRAVWGTVKTVRTAEESLGVRPNGKSTNWYLEIGNMTVAGCQIHYAIKCDTCNFGNAYHSSYSDEHGLKEYQLPCAIYNANNGCND